MAKYPKLPQGSMNPFERQLREPARRELRGCGDPNCMQCNPLDREGSPQYSAEDTSDMPSSSDTQRAMYEAAVKLMQGKIDRYPWIIPLDEAGSRKTAAEAALAAARKEVEDYIFEVEPTVDWSGVVGNDTAKQALLEAVEHPITKKEIYAFYGLRPLAGVLLWGPPGCGKTMFGKAAAGALARLHGAKTEMLVINGAQLQSPWVGVTEKKITSFFSYARAYHASHGRRLVIFIDEADAILPSRSGSARYEVSNVSTFLAEMDGMRENSAFVILATNRPETIDEALLRDGRIDRKIKVERPGLAEASTILHNDMAAARSADPQWVKEVVDYLVHPDRKITSFTAIRGTGETMSVDMTLANIISGAMLVGLTNRAKAIAFRRDITRGEVGGMRLSDYIAAIEELVQENKDLPHLFAAQEMMEALNLRETQPLAKELN